MVVVGGDPVFRIPHAFEPAWLGLKKTYLLGERQVVRCAPVAAVERPCGPVYQSPWTQGADAAADGKLIFLSRGTHSPFSCREDHRRHGLASAARNHLVHGSHNLVGVVVGVIESTPVVTVVFDANDWAAILPSLSILYYVINIFVQVTYTY
jgi:hypothetical protein